MGVEVAECSASKEPPREMYSTDEVVRLYDSDGRPRRTDTRNKEEQGLRQRFLPQVITRRPGG
jgi:hypothetical protein